MYMLLFSPIEKGQLKINIIAKINAFTTRLKEKCLNNEEKRLILKVVLSFEGSCSKYQVRREF